MQGNPTNKILVCVPSQLVNQWLDEFTKFSKEPLKILKITTIVQHKRYTLDHFISAGKQTT